MPRYYRKIIRVTVEDSPNVQLARAEIAAGREPSDTIIMPGVKWWSLYQKELKIWDDEQKCVSHEGRFYEGPELKLFPPHWLDLAEKYADELAVMRVPRIAKAIGIDPGEGAANTAMAAIDELGLIDLESHKTPDTSVIPRLAADFMRRHNVPPEMVCFDKGGGGKQHADVLRAAGKAVRTIGFGETINLEPKRGLRMTEERKESRDERYVYVNRRAEMYGDLSTCLDPGRRGSPFHYSGGSISGFAIPRRFHAIRQQLSPIPKTRDGEGRLYLLPKNKKDPDSKEKTLTELIGHSPDEADALVLALFAMTHRPTRTFAGAIV